MFASKALLSLTSAALMIAAPGARASEPDSMVVTAPVQVILTSGDTLQARCVQPAPFDMAAVVSSSGAVRYVQLVQIQLVRQGSRELTPTVVDRRKTVGEPLPMPVRPPRAPKPQRVGPRSITKSFLLTETSWLGRADFHEHRLGDQDFYFGTDIGEMFNISDHTALGFSGFFGSGDQYVNAGARDTSLGYANCEHRRRSEHCRRRIPGARQRRRAWLRVTGGIEPLALPDPERAGFHRSKERHVLFRRVPEPACHD